MGAAPTAGAGALADQLALLVAKQEILEVLLRYCRGIDRRDLGLLRAAFHPNSFDDHGNFTGSGWEFARWAIDRLGRRPQVTTHVITNALIEVDGDVARSESYFVGVHVLPAGDATVTHEFHGRYLDRFERRDGRWAISRRAVVHDWNETRTITPAQDPADPRFTRGRAYPDDLVYTL